MSLEDLREALSKVVDATDIFPRDYQKDGCVLEIRAEADQIEAVAEAAREADFFLECITGLDFTNGLQVIYHFNAFSNLSRVLVRVQLSGIKHYPPSAAYMTRLSGTSGRSSIFLGFILTTIRTCAGFSFPKTRIFIRS
jgi:NADH:ubiquinone oxidoreductase subunit C